MGTPPSPPEGDPVANKHTAIGVCLNLLLLVLVGYGYAQSEDYQWAWVLVGVPITIVTLRYVRHLLKPRS